MKKNSEKGYNVSIFKKKKTRRKWRNEEVIINEKIDLKEKMRNIEGKIVEVMEIIN